MRSRLILLLVFLALWIAGIVGKLGAVSVIDHELYRAKAANQQQRVVPLTPARGTIRDARGRELAVSVEVDSVWADPSQVTDPAGTAAALAEVLGLGPEGRRELEAELGSDTRFVWLARQLDPPVARQVRALGSADLRFQHESKRYYPNRRLAAPILGYVGTDSEGLGGLEALHDDRITGRAGRETVLADARRRRAVSPHLAFDAPEPGHHLQLTLDAAIQHIVERELARTVEEFHAVGGSAVVLDPHGGAVLAMASYPGFDPNRFGDYPDEARTNPAIQGAYEPGSTFKMITATAALSSNAVDPNDVIDCEMGQIRVPGRLIHDHKPFGLLTFREVIAKSSNVGAVKVGLQVGERHLYETARGFGFGTETGIDLPGENPGLLWPVERWQEHSSLASISFGHEVSITPLQLANAFAAVANGGTLYRPYVVGAVFTPEGDVVERGRRRALGRPLAPTLAREVERLLEGVVTEGTGKAAAVPGYTVAGKTGTAQKVIDQRYAPGKYIASFAGFVPARRPALVAAVVIDEPRPPFYHGGQVAAPAFAAMAEPILLHLDVPPDRDALDRWPEETRTAAAPDAEPGPEPTATGAAG